MANFTTDTQIPGNTLRYLSLFLFLLLISGQLLAQGTSSSTAPKKALKAFEQANEYINKREYDKAKNSLLNALEEAPDYIEALIYMADLMAVTGDPTQAMSYYQRALDTNPSIGQGLYYKLARAAMDAGEYDKAVSALQLYLKEPELKDKSIERAEVLLEQAKYSAEAVRNPVPFNPVNLGPLVNDKDPAYLPSISADESVLIFTKRVDNRQEDFYMSRHVDGEWTKAVDIGPPVNTNRNEGAQNISPDGKSLYYTACNVPNAYGSCDIYLSVREGDGWSRPLNLGNAVNSGWWDSQPSISADGKTLFFVSNRPGGFGDMDIYYCKLGNDGEWQPAINIGEVINTPKKEQSPFIHPDGQTLYFSSEGHPGMGDFDLYLSRLQPDLSWGDPVNLGYPINTTANDGTLVVSADGSTAYFSSSRKDTHGGLDIYSFEMPESLKPQPVSIVKAMVLDKDSGKPVWAETELISLENGEILLRSENDPITGEFLMCLPVGVDYALNINAKGYLFHSENFSLKEVKANDNIALEIKLSPVRIGEKIRLNNIFFETASWELKESSAVELGKLHDLLSGNRELQIRVNGHTDDVGNDEANLDLSEKRAKSVKDFLVARGIDSSRITYKGFGEGSPLSENDTEEGRAMNRRTEVEVIGM